MNKEIKKIVEIPLAMIEPDPLQPRKNFDAVKLASLMSSIKKHGIKNPLSVEKMDNGKYILVDGERRFRASTELGLKTVPAIVEESRTETERLIQQFHVQEQHEGWSATEKALAVGRLADELNLGITEVASVLDLNRHMIGRYIAFSKLITKKEFAKFEVPVDFAVGINNLKMAVKKEYREKLQQEFNKDKELELAVLERIKSGSITRRYDLLRLRDSVKMNPRSIEKFISDSSLSVDYIFNKEGAQSAWFYRNVTSVATNIASNIRKGMTLNFEIHFEQDEAAQKQLKGAYDAIGKLLTKFF